MTVVIITTIYATTLTVTIIVIITDMNIFDAMKKVILLINPFY